MSLERWQVPRARTSRTVCVNSVCPCYVFETSLSSPDWLISGLSLEREPTRTAERLNLLGHYRLLRVVGISYGCGAERKVSAPREDRDTGGGREDGDG